MTTLGRHVATAVLRAIALVAIALTGLFSLLEFVEQLASVGEGRYHVPDALLFVLLTAPSRLLQVAPASALIGCLIALGGMARHSELTAMRGLGFSERRIVGFALGLVPPLTVVLFLTMEFVIPSAQQVAVERRASALATPHAGGDEAGYWVQHGRQYLNVQRFERGDEPEGIALYSFGADGGLTGVLEADRAAIRPDGTWLLSNVSRRRIDHWTVRLDHLPTLAWHSFVTPGEIRFLIVPLGSVAPVALFEHIAHLPPDRRAPRDEQVFWNEVSLPLVLVAMIVTATPFVFGSPRGQGSGRMLAGGIGVGIAFSLGQQIVGRLGLLFDLSPALTAFLPPLLMIGLALGLSRRGRGA